MVTVRDAIQPLAGSRDPKTPANGNRTWTLASTTWARGRRMMTKLSCTGPA
jgi:hypothetical protein